MLTNTLVQTFYSNRIFDFKEKNFGVDVRGECRTVGRLGHLVDSDTWSTRTVGRPDTWPTGQLVDLGQSLSLRPKPNKGHVRSDALVSR